MVTRYRIRNWREYQHYKGRRPPWIKVHVKTLTSKDWQMLADASRLTMVVCMLLASLDDAGDGSFDGDPEYIKRVAYLDTVPDLTPLVECGFLEDASTCKQMLANASPSVSVSVSEVSNKNNVFNNMPEILSTDEFKEAWTKWRVYKRDQGFPVQPMQEIEIWSKLAREGPEDAVEIVLHAIRKGWKSIVFDYEERVKRSQQPYYPTGEEIMAKALKEQKERDDAKRAAQRCGIRADTGQPGDAKPGGVRGGVRDSLA